MSLQHRKVSFDPGYQLLNCLDCIESDSLLFTRIEKMFATSQGMFRYKEIVYIVIIFLEHSSQWLTAPGRWGKQNTVGIFLSQPFRIDSELTLKRGPRE